jgi:hypothetical protein
MASPNPRLRPCPLKGVAFSGWAVELDGHNSAGHRSVAVDTSLAPVPAATQAGVVDEVDDRLPAGDLRLGTGKIEAGRAPDPATPAVAAHHPTSLDLPGVGLDRDAVAVPAPISHKMLSQTLQSLCADSLVARRVEDSVPPKVFYRLTPLGLSLEQPLAALRNWAEENVQHCHPAQEPA